MLAQDVIKHLASSISSTTSGEHDYDAFQMHDGFLYRHGLLYIPDEPPRVEILQVSNMAGHIGIAKTTELISRNYWWSSLWKLVQALINSCDTCSWAKAP